jgi:abhydrolase domain-containing protein 6
MPSQIKKLFLLIPVLIVVVLVGLYYLFPAATFALLTNLERNAAGLQPQRISIEGLQIEYLEGGKGEPLVLLHGFGGDKDNWTRFGKHVTPHFKVIAPDLPGFGESSADPDLNYTISAQVDRVKAFVQALGIPAFHLGGNSM